MASWTYLYQTCYVIIHDTGCFRQRGELINYWGDFQRYMVRLNWKPVPIVELLDLGRWGHYRWTLVEKEVVGGGFT